MKIAASSLLLFLPLLGAAQVRDADTPPSYSNSVTVSASQSLGEFSETHSIGISARYLRQAAPVMKIRKRSTGGIGLIYGGGLGWNKGKKEWLNGYAYRYGDFLHLYMMGGINYPFLKNAEAGIALGPALTRYRSVNRFNLYGGLYASAFFNGNWGLEGGLDLLKENKAAWMAMIKIGGVYRF